MSSTHAHIFSFFTYSISRDMTNEDWQLVIKLKKVFNIS